MFLGCSVFFAIHDAVSAARQERGISGPLRFRSPLTPEKIRMACEDTFTKMVCCPPEKKHKILHFCPLAPWPCFFNPLLWFSRGKTDDRNPLGHASGMEWLLNLCPLVESFHQPGLGWSPVCSGPYHLRGPEGSFSWFYVFP